MLTILLVVTGAEGIALGIAGVVAPLLAQLIKKWSGTSGNVALGISIAVSAVIAVVAAFVSGDVHDIGELVKSAGTVFGIATVVFKLFMAETKPTT